MAEQKDTINGGVPMSNGIGGTVPPNSPSPSGGGGANSANTNTNSGNSAGNTGSSSSSSAPGTNNSGGTNQETNVEYLKGAIDSYLGVSALAFTFGSIVDIYINNKLKFDELGQEYLDKATLTEEEKKEVKDNIKKEKEALKEYFTNGPGKEELKKKFDELKATSFELKKTVSAVPKEFAKMIAEAAMPNVIGPVGPNPFSGVLKVYNGLARIKKVIDSIFISLQAFINVAESLGVAQTQPFEQFMGVIAAPMRGLEGLSSKVKKKEESLSADLELQGKIDEAKKGWSYVHDNGKTMNAKQVEELARDNRFKMYVFPLTSGNRKNLDKAIEKIYSPNVVNRIKAQDAKIIKKYDDWTNWMLAELKKSQQTAQNSGGSGGASFPNESQISAPTVLGTSEGAMGPSA